MVQWENFRPLLDNSVAGGNDNLVVGDVKQSIYSFRGAVPKLFMDRANRYETGEEEEYFYYDVYGLIYVNGNVIY